MIYLYGAVDDGRAASQALGPDQHEVSVIDCGGIAFVVREGPELTPSGDTQELLDHDRIVRRIMAACSVVPFRFGTVVGHTADLSRWLDGRTTQMQELFDRLRGRRELALRVRPKQSTTQRRPTPQAPNGRTYLRSLARQAGGSTAAELHRAMAAAAVASVAQRDGDTFKAAYLVDDEAIDECCSLLETMHVSMTDAEVSLTGPWAPYSFVTDALDAPEGLRQPLPALETAP